MTHVIISSNCLLHYWGGGVFVLRMLWPSLRTSLKGELQCLGLMVRLWSTNLCTPPSMTQPWSTNLCTPPSTTQPWSTTLHDSALEHQPVQTLVNNQIFTPSSSVRFTDMRKMKPCQPFQCAKNREVKLSHLSWD